MFTPSFLSELVTRAGTERPEGDRACETLLQFLAVAQAVRECLRGALAEHGCTEFGFEVLTTLRDAEGGLLPPSIIAERSGILRGTLTDVLARLEACGLIARHRNETDRRQLLAELTPRGKNLCERVIDHYVHAMLDLATAITPEARSMMHAALASVSRAAAKPSSDSIP